MAVLVHGVAPQGRAPATDLNWIFEIAPQSLPLAVLGIDYKDGGKEKWCDVVDDRPFRNSCTAKRIDSKLQHFHSTDDES
jgi:hypothetical protein